jgi:hypothetical protein
VSFLDGLLAALNALSPTPAGPTATATASIETMNVAAAVIAMPVAAPTADQPASPVVTVPTVADPAAAPETVVATVEPAANPAVNPAVSPAKPGVAKLSPRSEPGGAVFTQSSWSVSQRPGRRVTLHSVGVESLEAPRAAANTPQAQQVPSGALKATAANPAAASNSEVKPVAVETAAISATVDAVAAVAAPAKDPLVKDADVKDSDAKVADAKDAKPKVEPDVASDTIAATEAVVVTAVNAPASDKASAQLPLRGRRETTQSAVTPIDDASPRPAQHEGARYEPTPTPTAAAAVAIDHVDHTAVAPTTTTMPTAAQSTSTLTASSPKAATAPAGHATPVNLGMIGVDRVRFAREQAPSRAVQRLSIDLDGAQVALRFRGDRVVVDVVNDPAGTLGNGWARQVERSLDQAVRTVSEPQRGGQSTDQNGSQPGGSGKGGTGTSEGSEHDRPRPAQRAFTLFDEEED